MLDLARVIRGKADSDCCCQHVHRQRASGTNGDTHNLASGCRATQTFALRQQSQKVGDAAVRRFTPTARRPSARPHREVKPAKVAAGEYATESEVIREGLRALLARDRAAEGWLLNDVAAAYDALKADPSKAVSADEVRASLAALHKKTVGWT